MGMVISGIGGRLSGKAGGVKRVADCLESATGENCHRGHSGWEHVRGPLIARHGYVFVFLFIDNLWFKNYH